VWKDSAQREIMVTTLVCPSQSFWIRGSALAVAAEVAASPAFIEAKSRHTLPTKTTTRPRYFSEPPSQPVPTTMGRILDYRIAPLNRETGRATK
jgi:hypothetical protein